MTAEDDRTRLIGEIARVLRDDPVPDDARAAALTLIGWLARRMPGEAVSTAGVPEMIGTSHERPVPRASFAAPSAPTRGQLRRIR